MFFKEGHNCWKLSEAGKVSFLVDGEDYFRAVADACEAAEQHIYIVGWDIDSRIRLRRGDNDQDETFVQFLDRLATVKPALNIYLLEWDFVMLYSLERETWPLLKFGWNTHKRIHFELDDKHPVGASHHQKIVVIDDKIAFVGGFDLAICRWDTPQHAPGNRDRVDDNLSYGPFHDVQMLVSGDCAGELGKIARQRWENATGVRLSQPAKTDSTPWPGWIEPALEMTPVAIMRTLPEHDGQSEVREIERFHLEAIRQARSSIYIENQYLTSHLIGKSLEEVLEKETGPEVLLVLPRSCSGWLEQETMGALRQRLLKRLYAADRHHRLKICYPYRTDLGDDVINVHSKVMVIDDKLLTIGSANLSNRSMGFDTECNLALSSDGNAEIAAAITGFRNRLLAEHLGADAEKITTSLDQTGSLIETTETAGSDQRSLETLHPEEESPLADTLSAEQIIDPERPIRIDQLMTFFDLGHPDSKEQNARHKGWLFVTALACAILLAAMWRWSPLNQWLNIDNLLAIADAVRESPLTIPIVLALYIVGSCLMFPITIMILATALSFGPVLGFFLAFSGCLGGGLASYFMGRWLGRDVVRKLAGEKLNRLSRKIARRGWLAVAIVRIVPVAPFTIVNMVAGSTHISARSFLIGTGVGMGPGILAIMIFEGGFEQALRNPGWGSLTLALSALVLATLIVIGGKFWMTRQEESRDDKE